MTGIAAKWGVGKPGAIVLALALSIAAACGGDAGENKVTAMPETPRPVIEQEVTPTVEMQGATASVLNIGDRAEVEGFPDIIVVDFIRSADAPAAQGGGHFEIEPGREFFIVTLRVINDTDLPAGIGPFVDLQIFSRGENINEALSILIAVEGGLEADVLPPGDEATGRVAWSAPPGFDDLSLQYVPFSEAEGAIEELPQAIIDLD